MVGHRSVHSTQMLAFRKSASIQVQVGQEPGKVDTKFQLREKSVRGLLFSLMKTLRKKIGW